MGSYKRRLLSRAFPILLDKVVIKFARDFFGIMTACMNFENFGLKGL